MSLVTPKDNFQKKNLRNIFKNFAMAQLKNMAVPDLQRYPLKFCLIKMN